MHKAFISYHHANDQLYKDSLVDNFSEGVLLDRSVDTGDISDDLDDQTIRTIIRDEYLRDSSVTIVLVGEETRKRKHVDWEIFSSMIDGKINKKSGILVVDTLTDNPFTHGIKEQALYPEVSHWKTVNSKEEYARDYPDFPERLVDNYQHISVIPWKRLTTGRLQTLLDYTFDRKGDCEYDLRRRMRRHNS